VCNNSTSVKKETLATLLMTDQRVKSSLDPILISAFYPITRKREKPQSSLIQSKRNKTLTR
jgi:hypothetical protein